MASALASPPPLFSISKADLKANARKFLERALVISALIHFSAVGLFRAALERFAATEDEIPAVTVHWSDPTFLTPPPVPIPRPPAGNPSDKGEIVLVAKGPIIQAFDPGATGHDPIADPGVGRGAGEPAPGGLGVPPEKPERVFKVVDTPPVPRLAPRPAYPEWEREALIEGKVLLRVLVGTDGFVKQVIVKSGEKGLGEEAAKAVRRWTFWPGLSNGEPVEVWVEIPISFRLGE